MFVLYIFQGSTAIIPRRHFAMGREGRTGRGDLVGLLQSDTFLLILRPMMSSNMRALHVPTCYNVCETDFTLFMHFPERGSHCIVCKQINWAVFPVQIISCRYITFDGVSKLLK